jgi:protein O-GlcNAc transferase
VRSHGNLPEPGRRLRIGYVSGDLREHPVGQFMEPVLRHHDRGGFEIFCYANTLRADDRTGRLKAHADAWREVFALDDAGMEALIREDAIDILVDLSGHTGANRLPVFGRKPAPVQATWLGYLNTTGLKTIDWRITDAKASPEALKAYHSERLLYLPDSQWCYQAPPNCPETSPPPSLSAGHITFGAFTNLAKIGAPVIELWCRLLERVPHSRLLVVGNGLGAIGEEVMARFTRHGAAPDRIELRNAVPFGDYLALHAQVDIMLDTFPYAGGTTSCHALWMGVPIVTMTGETASSCGGASLLQAIGLPDLVAQTPGQYLDIAAGLAIDQVRLAELRARMRSRMSASPLTDAPRFTRNLESAYRSMWHEWCESAEAPN